MEKIGEWKSHLIGYFLDDERGKSSAERRENGLGVRKGGVRSLREKWVGGNEPEVIKDLCKNC